jgi:protease IV
VLESRVLDTGGRIVSKTKVAGIVVLAVVVLSVIALAVVGTRTAPTARGPDQVAVVHLDGPIQEAGIGGVLSPGAITPDIVRRRLAQVEADPRIRAVILRINSPGGTVGASQEITELIAGVDVPVVVSMGDQAASGGYYIATAADGIVAQPGTLTGSIGVIWSTLDVDELLDRLGVELDAITAGEHKDMFLPGRTTPERRALIQAVVDDSYADFVAAVVEGRGLSDDEARELATGVLFTGRQALDLGLVDALGGFDEALAIAEDLAGIEDARVVELRPTFFEQFAGGPGFDLRGLLGGGLPSAELVLIRDIIDGYNVPRYALP